MTHLVACTVDLADGRVERDGQALRLTEMERKLLAYLVEHTGRDVPREELLTEVWGYAPTAVSRTVTATVHRLRAKIERDAAHPDHVVTVWGAGFRFEPRQTAPPGPRLDLDRFFGRTSLLEAVREGLGTHRLITLVGPGGIGKTRLARQLAAESPVPVVWIEVEAATSAEQLAGAAARALGMRLGSADDVAAGLRERGPVLAVLDNVETVTDDVAHRVQDWLTAAPALTLLCTSRVALRLSGEVVHPVGALGAEAAEALFRDRLPPGVPVDEAAVAAVLRPLDGMPLAVELAARLADLLPLPELAARLERPLDLLTDDRRDRPARHQSLRTALQGSFEALSADEQRALAWLAVVEGDLAVADAEALLGPSAIGHLRALQHRSLLQRSAGGHRLLSPVRAFAREHLAELGQAAEARAQWGHWLAAESGRRFDPAGRPAQEHDLAWAAAHHVDLRAAWERAVDAHPEQAAALAGALVAHHQSYGPLTESLHVLGRTLALELPRSVRGHLLRWLGRSRAHLRDRDGALEAAHQALAIAEEIGDRVLEGRVCGLLVFCTVRDPATAERMADRARQIQTALGDEAGLATTLGNLATSYWSARRLDEAVRTYARAIELHEATGNRRSRAICLANLGAAHVERGAPDAARDALRRALEGHRGVGDRIQEANTLTLLGLLALSEDRFEDAAELFAASASLGITAGAAPRRLAFARFFEGVAHLFTGDLEQALVGLERAQGIIDRGALSIPEPSLVRAWIRLRQGQAGSAETLVAHPPAAPDRHVECIAVLLRGLLLASLHEAGRAPQGRQEAWQLLVRGRTQVAQESKLSVARLFLRELEARFGPAGVPAA